MRRMCHVSESISREDLPSIHVLIDGYLASHVLERPSPVQTDECIKRFDHRAVSATEYNITPSVDFTGGDLQYLTPKCMLSKYQWYYMPRPYPSETLTCECTYRITYICSD